MNLRSKRRFLLFVIPALTCLGPASVCGGVVTQVPHPPATHRHPHLAQHLLTAPSVWKHQTRPPKVSDLTWSADGRWAAYYLTETRNFAPTTREDLHNWERKSLCCIRSDGSEAHRLYTGTGDGFEPELAAWSPDSTRILFWETVAHAGSVNKDGSCLYDVTARTSKTRLLTVPFKSSYNVMDNGMMREPSSLAFSPNGKYLLLVRGFGRFETQNKRLVRITYPAGAQKWLTKQNIAAICPVWSQDSRRIAFLACPERRGEWGSDVIEWQRAHTHLWVMDSTGQHLQQLTTDARYQEDNADSPQWLPDRQTIRFSRQENASDGNGKSSIWAIHADGTGLKRARGLSKLSGDRRQ